MSEHSSPSVQKASIGYTACMTAAVRAHESLRADHLFTDPWAAWLASNEGFTILEKPVVLLHAYGWKATFVPSALKGFEYQRPVFPFIPEQELTLDKFTLYHLLFTARKE
ncbi:hypothetical protein [Thermogemmatispora carboxidivorans]|uniref:hypothetical protein n=1 Tax=Thermogemmatispora carboxidivorans TaxID=1382306 RepID=UPI00069B15B2|nr:hypothetical protein [Thermogemmatispora carboxidivorans]